MSWWNYVICVVCFMIGKSQAAYSIIIPMICVNFALPFTKEIEKTTGVSTTNVRRKIKNTIWFWTIINFVAFVLLNYFVPLAYALSYALGSIFVIFYIGKTKKNMANISDYYNVYLQYFPSEHMDRIDNYFKEHGYIQ